MTLSYINNVMAFALYNWLKKLQLNLRNNDLLESWFLDRLIYLLFFNIKSVNGYSSSDV